MWNMVGYYAVISIESICSKELLYVIVVKNPLSPVEHPGGIGVNNELFEESLEQFVVSTSIGILVSTFLTRVYRLESFLDAPQYISIRDFDRFHSDRVMG